MRQVLLYQDEDGVWIAEVPSLPGCGSDGMTREEALENVKDAIALWIEDAEAHGEAIPTGSEF
ncbi:MAG: type II toxin-antitoxin system HicB family antitoxin [bacterium]|nr:type II toxin-antitoxin system HicB family antitoxin [bacterium]